MGDPSEVLKEALIGVVLEALFLFIPYAYIKIKKGLHTFLFSVFCIGLLTVTQALITTLISPFVAVMLIEFDGEPSNMWFPILNVAWFIQDYWFSILLAVTLVMYIVVPPIVYRRCQIFRSENA